MKAKRTPILGRCVHLLAIFILAMNVASFQIQPAFAASLLSVDNSNPACNDATGDPFCTIQAAVDAAVAGDTINVAAGTYVQSTVLNLNKANLTLEGTGNPLIQVSGTGDRFNISAAGVIINGFKIEKTDKAGLQEIIRIAASNTSVTNNEIFGHYVIGDGDVSRAIVINAGAFTGLDISGNTIHDLRQPAYISGTHTGTISNNNVYRTKGWVLEGGNLTFTNNTWGTGADANVYDIAIIPQMPALYYTDIVAMSNANNGAVIEDQRVSPAVLSTVYADAATSFTSDLGGRYHPYSSIAPALTRVVAGGTIHLAAGTYTETGQVVISKNMTMVGADKITTILKPGQNTGTAGDARTWILVNTGVEFNLSNVTLDGSGKLVETAFLSHGTGVFENNIVKNIYYSKYLGRGVALYGGNMTIRDNSFSNIQRIGMYAALAGTTSAVFDGNTYTGKGPGDWLDYGIELEAGAHAEIMNNTISDAVGVAALDGSTSAGLYLTTYFAPGTSMNAHNNILVNNTVGLSVGYSADDTSTTVATHNKFEGNEFGIATTGPAVTADGNWWGSASGPLHTSNTAGTGDEVSDNVSFTPWLCSGNDTSPEPGFQPSLQPNGSCTNINVEIGADNQATFSISSQGTLTQVPFSGVNQGPVRLQSTASILGGERVIYKVNGINTSFSEMMALPAKQLDTTYWLPWYNNVDLDTQLRIANVTDQTATVTITIGGVPQPSFDLAAGQSTRKSFAGLNAGPVKITSTQNIVAAERVIYKVNGINTSFSEMMALPAGRLDSVYWFTRYNNKDLDTQLRIANVTDQTATVTITIGGVPQPSFDLAAGQSTRKSFAGLNGGLVKVESNVAIVVAERVIYKINGINTSFSEMMGLPSNLLDTTYWMPWYNNVDLDTHLRFGLP